MNFDKCCKSGGNVEYMAPERISVKSKVGYPKSDFWSLGATVYCYNRIKEIPKEIGQLHNLQKLDLSDNQISEIPKEIGHSQNLQELDLSVNQIKEIPKEIGQLQNLQILNLYNNEIREIPKFVNSNTKVFF